MARNILLRFNANDELLILIDKISEKLGVTKSSLTRMALHDYCVRLLAKEKNGKSN